jgi:hypothetical protein
MVPQRRFELPTYGLLNRRSSQLSYRGITLVGHLGNDPSQAMGHWIYSPSRVLNGILPHSSNSKYEEIFSVVFPKLRSTFMNRLSSR